MSSDPTAFPEAPLTSGTGLLSVLALRRTRAMVRGFRGRALFAGIATLYGATALLIGSMVQIAPTGATGTSITVLTNHYSPAWWNYPAVLVVSPNGILVLPFLETISMVLVSLGVGLGMAAGLLLAVRIVRSWRTARAEGRGSAAPLAGLTPAMVAMLTLGACCSTSAAAAGSMGALAEVSGTSYDQILLNSWLLNLFQIAVLAIALIAQEQLLAVYGGLLVGPAGAHEAVGTDRRAVSGRAFLPVLAVRLFLVVGGTLWTLSFLIAWADGATAVPLAAFLVSGSFERGVLGLAAIAGGLLPTALVKGAAARVRRHPGAPVRGPSWDPGTTR
jgi:bacteriorhodopsin